MKSLKPFILASLVLVFTGCSSVNDSSSGNSLVEGDWLIPRGEVVDGGPGQDGIPSIDDPQFSVASNVSYVGETRIVTGIKIGDTIKAYPHQVMDHHEIVNDAVGDTPYCLTLCPLTGTAIAWERVIDGETVEFGVSGWLFRNNLIPYDRKTGSRYSQMQMRGINGPESSTQLNTIQVIQTTWSTWREMYPDSQVLTTNTGFSRNYSGYVYGRDYYLDENSGTLFPVQNSDNRLPNKARVHGIIAELPADQNAQVKVYQIGLFGEGVHLVSDQVGGEDVIVAGSTNYNFAVSFHALPEDGTELNFEPVQDELPFIMEDQEGNRWDLFGYAVEGPRQGEQLAPTNSYTGYWFAWADFFPELSIYRWNS
ncbi:DUF3179 domain-containing protein [Aliifodinibius sp. S!AR15-10]|uniref:DUF3179 domain-containing protein n=1 Tax=Aliifodinibius sp. S!AR15-10 TaxID=2950437 RepID=UPI0028611900|nr:DUF3179 domain-containing protein [Aliifodinibius sp. S!AR15-10]MDR8392930.1 DUF3179 domain-containing protein [Aliifodinibius sp. S!AR15-10]